MNNHHNFSLKPHNNTESACDEGTWLPQWLHLWVLKGLQCLFAGLIHLALTQVFKGPSRYGKGDFFALKYFKRAMHSSQESKGKWY